MKLPACVVLLLLATNAAGSSPHQLVSLSDPVGDDFGAGNLVYPQRHDFQPGDLDLKEFSIRRDDEGFWFEAEFKNPIRSPALATAGVGPESLAEFARRGFYTFNIDVYIDTDRIRGSGNLFTLPGRGARIDPGYAWDRMVLLTPRPEFIRGKLLDVLAKQYPDRSLRDAESSIDQSIYFAQRVRVRGKTIAFFVPASFFGGSSGEDWAITTLVTGAKIVNEAGIRLFPSQKTPLEELDMGVMQPRPGRPRDTFGYETARGDSPIVDALMPTEAQQVVQLGGSEPLRGLSWGMHAVDEAAQAGRYEGARSQAMARRTTSTAQDDESLLQGAWNSLLGLFGGSGGRQGTGVHSGGGTPAPLGSFLDPAGAGSQGGGMKHEQTGTPASSYGSPSRRLPGESDAPPPKPPLAVRLRTLQQLFDDKLIDEAEFQRQKQRILADL